MEKNKESRLKKATKILALSTGILATSLAVTAGVVKTERDRIDKDIHILGVDPLVQDAEKKMSKYQDVLRGKNGGKIDNILKMFYLEENGDFGIVATGVNRNKEEVINFIEGRTETPIKDFNNDSEKIFKQMKNGKADYNFYSALDKDKEVLSDYTTVYHSFSTKTDVETGLISVSDNAIVKYNPSRDVCGHGITYTMVKAYETEYNGNKNELKDKAKQSILDDVMQNYYYTNVDDKDNKGNFDLTNDAKLNFNKYQDLFKNMKGVGDITNIENMVYNKWSGKITITATGYNKDKEEVINYIEGRTEPGIDNVTSTMIFRNMENGSATYNVYSAKEAKKEVVDDNTTIYHSVFTITNKETGMTTVTDNAIVYDDGTYYVHTESRTTSDKNNAKEVANEVMKKVSNHIVEMQEREL